MKNIVFIGAHLGYPMDSVPLGGGAMVGLHLARRWAGDPDFRLIVLGSGPKEPAQGLEYVRLAPQSKELVRLSELGYARFCEQFSSAALEFLGKHRARLAPDNTCIVLNDISEGPDAGRLSSMGYPVVSIWHVDVVDFFNKMYLHGMVAPERWTRAFDRVAALGLSGAVPRVLRLVFEKQRQAVAHSRLLVLPSSQMADTIRDCYRHLFDGSSKIGPAVAGDPWASRLLVLPWGGWTEDVSEAEVEREASAIRDRFRIGADTRVIMTLSRLSPGKGHPLLLQALNLLERRADRPKDLRVFVCGEPAFMRSGTYTREVRAAAERLKSFRIFFPGYLCPLKKQAFFRAAQLFVSPSVHESYGLSIVEALRAGLPILASDHSGADEILSPQFSRVVPYNGQTGGWLSFSGRHGDIPARLADALAELLADPAKLRAMGRAAKAAGEKMSFADAARRLRDAALSQLPAEPEPAGAPKR